MKKFVLKSELANLTEQLRTTQGELEETRLGQARWRLEALELRRQLDESNKRVKQLYAENDELIHTPEFAVDTKSAVDRGRQDGIRSMSQRAQNDMLSMLNDMYVEMEKVAHKYTRNLTYDVFTANVEAPQSAKSLPDTEMAQKIREAAVSMTQ